VNLWRLMNGMLNSDQSQAAQEKSALSGTAGNLLLLKTRFLCDSIHRIGAIAVRTLVFSVEKCQSVTLRPSGKGAGVGVNKITSHPVGKLLRVR
jgi:hypothetical protein